VLGTATGRGRISIFAPSKWTPRANARVLTFIVKRQSTEVLRTFPHRAPNVIVIRIRRRSSVDVGSSSLPRAQAPMHAARPRSICLRVNSRAPVTAQLTKLASQLDDIDWVLGCEDALSAAWSARASVARLPSMHRSFSSLRSYSDATCPRYLPTSLSCRGAFDRYAPTPRQFFTRPGNTER